MRPKARIIPSLRRTRRLARVSANELRTGGCGRFSGGFLPGRVRGCEAAVWTDSHRNHRMARRRGDAPERRSMDAAGWKATGGGAADRASKGTGEGGGTAEFATGIGRDWGRRNFRFFPASTRNNVCAHGNFVSMIRLWWPENFAFRSVLQERKDAVDENLLARPRLPDIHRRRLSIRRSAARPEPPIRKDAAAPVRANPGQLRCRLLCGRFG